MELRPLEITLISADDVKNVNMFGKMDVYAVAFIFGYPKTKKKTKVDKNCGTSPRWNQKVQFTIDERSLSNPGLTLVIQLKADKSFRPDRNIGEVSVAIPELFKNGNGNDTAAERLVEYQVMTSSGTPKGSLKLCYKFAEKLFYDNNADSKKAEKTKEKNQESNEPVTAYPPPGYNRQGQAGASTPAPAATPYAPPQPGMGYQQPPPGYGYPHQQGQYGAYPPPGGYPHPGYGYAPPPGHGYQQPVQPPKKTKNGMGMGLGLGAGLLGGMLIGDMVSDAGEMAAYNEGYEDAMGDVSGFDF